MKRALFLLTAAAVSGVSAAAAVQTLAPAASAAPSTESPAMSVQHTLTERQSAILPIGAFIAIGDVPRLKQALAQGLDAGLTVAEIKEVLVQLYAYAGFPRSLNSVAAFMEVLKERQGKGIQDAAGDDPGPLPAPERLRDVGTANQTQLVGKPAASPIYDFAPAVDDYLKAHLFGAIFSRDNLDWQSRELATLSALCAGRPGVAVAVAHGHQP